MLVRANELLDAADLATTVTRVARWLHARRTAVPKLLPGLYFGYGMVPNPAGDDARAAAPGRAERSWQTLHP